MTGAALYVKRRGARRGRPARRGLRDGLRGRRLLPARLGGRASASSTARTPSLTHLESKTRGMAQGERELASQRRFWARWGAWFDERDVRAEDGGLRIVYVTEDTGVGGGHRVVFQHLNGLAARGHHCELWTLGDAPDWFDLDVPVRSFPDYGDADRGAGRRGRDQGRDLVEDGAGRSGRPPCGAGVPVYFVQDIETSYYAEDHGIHGARARHLPAGVPLPEHVAVGGGAAARAGPRRRAASRRGSTSTASTALGRERHRARAARARPHQPAEELPAHGGRPTARCPSRGPELWLFGIEPELGEPLGARYHGGAQRRGGQRAAQHGHRVRADLAPRGLLPAGARGDGHRRPGRLHRRARQPRLLPRRRELPHARGRAATRWRRPSRGCSATRRCARGSPRRGSRRPRRTTGAGGSESSSAFFERVAGSRAAVAR